MSKYLNNILIHKQNAKKNLSITEKQAQEDTNR